MAKLSEKDRLHHVLSGKDISASGGPGFVEYRRKWEENPKGFNPGPFPIHLDIEVTSLCNLRCPFCATTYRAAGVKNGFMKWKTLKRVLDQAGEYGAYACKFNMRGEPLLHKELGKFIKYAKKKGIIDVFFNTNAVLLNEEKARMLIDSGLDRLTVSFEGFDKATYEKNRIGANFEEVVANVERLRELRDKLNYTKPKIRLQAVLAPELKNQIDEFIAFWKDRVDEVSYNEMLDNAPKKIKLVKSSWACPFPYQRIMVMWDGAITACYNDFYGKLAMGNIHSTTIRDCWISSLENLRKLHRDGRADEIEACAKCPLRMNELRRRGEA